MQRAKTDHTYLSWISLRKHLSNFFMTEVRSSLSSSTLVLRLKPSRTATASGLCDSAARGVETISLRQGRTYSHNTAPRLWQERGWERSSAATPRNSPPPIYAPHSIARPPPSPAWTRLGSRCGRLYILPRLQTDFLYCAWHVTARRRQLYLSALTPLPLPSEFPASKVCSNPPRITQVLRTTLWIILDNKKHFFENRKKSEPEELHPVRRTPHTRYTNSKKSSFEVGPQFAI